MAPKKLVGALASFACAIAVATPTTASAKDDELGRPWARGTWGVSPNIGLGIGRDLIPLTLGVGGQYFVANGLGLGLSVNDTILIYTSSFKSRFPDVQNQIPTNAVYVTPTARYVLYRNHRFSPYIFGGLGPVFFNHGGGTLGYWQAGPAALIGIGGPLYLNLGIAFSGIFPNDKCLQAFTYRPAADAVDMVGFESGAFDIGCGFRWGPVIGLSFAPRGKSPPRRRKRRRDREQPDFEEPASNPLDEGPDDGFSPGAAGTSPSIAPPPDEPAAADAPGAEPPADVAPPPSGAASADLVPATTPTGDAADPGSEPPVDSPAEPEVTGPPTDDPAEAPSESGPPPGETPPTGTSESPQPTTTASDPVSPAQ